MKTKTGFIILVLASSLFISSVSLALPKDYSPGTKVQSGALSVLEQLKLGKGGMFKTGEISIRAEGTEGPISESNPVYHFIHKGKTVYKLNKNAKYSYLGEVWTADLDGNGLKDFVVYASYMGNGISPDSVVILFQTTPGKFRSLDFDTYGFDPKDFKDLDKDGKPEVVLCSLYGDEGIDGKLHSFWVYTAYKIENYSLNLMERGRAGFPRFTWFTNTPNDRETTKLSASQKQAYFKSLPSVIASA